MQNDGSVFAYGERARYSSSAPDATPCISTLRMPACGRPVLAGAVLTLTTLAAVQQHAFAAPMQAMGATAATAAGSASSQALPSWAPQVQAGPYLATTRSCCAGVLRSFCSTLPQLGSLQCMLLLDYCQLLHCSARTFSYDTPTSIPCRVDPSL